MQLQFKVEHKKNLKRHEFDRELQRFAKDPGHRESDMMILAILSHGREGNVFASDGTVIAIESIYEKFNNRNCPALQGKPKFFIIQVRLLRLQLRAPYELLAPKCARMAYVLPSLGSNRGVGPAFERKKNFGLPRPA